MARQQRHDRQSDHGELEEFLGALALADLPANRFHSVGWPEVSAARVSFLPP